MTPMFWYWVLRNLAKLRRNGSLSCGWEHLSNQAADMNAESARLLQSNEPLKNRGEVANTPRSRRLLSNDWVGGVECELRVW